MSLFGPRAAGIAAHLPAQAVLQLQRNRIGQPAVAVALQRDALALGQHRQFRQAEDHQLAVVADHRNVIVLGRDFAHHGQLDARLGGSSRRALCAFRPAVRRPRPQTAPGVAGQQQLRLGPVDQQRDDLRFGIDVEHGADRLAKAARAGQLVGAQRVEPAIVAAISSLSVVWRGARRRAIAFLELEILVERIVPLAARSSPWPKGSPSPAPSRSSRPC
jgi:hypothetical protein